MRTWSRYIALDLGAESGRAMLVVTNGERIKIEERHRYLNQPVLISGHLYWNLPRIYKEIKTSIKNCFLSSPDISSLAIDTWGTDFGFITKSGELVGLPFAYRDHKNDGMPKSVREIIPDSELYAMTGIQFMKVNTLYQLFAIVKSGSPLIKAAERLLFMPDLFNFFLCGSRVSEYTVASTSQLMDPVKKVWEKRIFERLGLSCEIMPEIVKHGTVLGKILPKQASELKISQLTIKATASHDTASAVACIPVTPDGKPWAFISSGTWSLVGTEVSQPFLTREAQQANLTNEGGVCGTIRLLKNVTGLWFIQRLRKDFALRGVEIDYPELTAAAKSAKAFRRFLDTESGVFHNPPDMITAIDRYLTKTKQPKAETPGEYARCIFESLAYKYADNLNLLERVTGKNFARIHVIGGGAKNDLLNSFTANAAEIEVLAGPAEATAIGNGLMQALSDGLFGSLAEMRKSIAGSFEVKKFLPVETEEWKKNFKRYREIISV